MWWGFSEALDLVDEISKSSQNPNQKDNIESKYNVLLIGQYDGRHVLKTIAQKYRHKDNVELNVYVYEPLLENVAKQLLFLKLALEPREQLGIAEKTLFFMELYGNTLLRPATQNYLSKASHSLLNMVTDLDFANQMLPNINLEQLKYKERDKMEIIFKYWASNNDSFDIMTYWNERVRKHLTTRYDSRYGVFDWDYHMRYHCYGADALKIHEYKRFRERGISFYFDDTDPCIPNKTLASAIFVSGSKILNCGYMGDIVTGPYSSFGFNCEDKEMFKKVNGQIPKTATDISERNITRMFYEIENQCPFIPTLNNKEYFGAIIADTSDGLKVKMDSSQNDLQTNPIRIKNFKEVYKSLSTNNCKITFLPSNALKDYCSSSRCDNFFDLIYVSQGMVLKTLNLELSKIWKSNSIIIVDTPKFLLNYRKEDLENFKKDLVNLMQSLQCKLYDSYDPINSEFARFIVEK